FNDYLFTPARKSNEHFDCTSRDDDAGPVRAEASRQRRPRARQDMAVARDGVELAVERMQINAVEIVTCLFPANCERWKFKMLPHGFAREREGHGLGASLEPVREIFRRYGGKSPAGASARDDDAIAIVFDCKLGIAGKVAQEIAQRDGRY